MWPSGLFECCGNPTLPVQVPLSAVDASTMNREKRRNHRDVVAGLQSLEMVNEALNELPESTRSQLEGHVDRLRDLMASFLLDGDTRDALEPAAQTGSFSQVARAEMDSLLRDARRKGIQMVCEFSPALRAIPFAVGGSILVGLVQQAIAAPITSGIKRKLMVTASIDERQRLVIGIEDSAESSREAYSVRSLGTWRRRIGELGGELLLRGVPFGSGTTIQAHLPVTRLAA
mgnify:CR=1 FL=1